MSEKKKIRTVVVDTLTAIQNSLYMTEKNSPSYDEWKDYGREIWEMIEYFQDNGFELILVLGEPGTGKSTGMRNLEPGTNMWFNADRKNPVWVGGKEQYGKKNNPKKPYHIIPKFYQDIYDVINEGLKREMFEEDRYAILTGHIEDYKSGNEYKKRLKTLGKQATKMQIEGKLESVFYSEVKKSNDGSNKYVLRTENSGYDTARSPMNLFEPTIDNDYKFIVDKLSEY